MIRIALQSDLVWQILLKNMHGTLSYCLLVLCCYIPFGLLAQESVILTKNFKFNDGLYYSFEDFRNNTPIVSWEELDTDLFVNPQTLVTKVVSIKKRGATKTASIDMDSLWGFSLGGIPYIRIPKGRVKTAFQVFAGIKLRGKICYYAYEQEVTKQIPMPVYNPLTRRPFYSSSVKRTIKEYQEWMLDFKSGNIAPFTVEQFKSWIKDDPDLLETIESFDTQKAKDRLFKCLLIYDDRNLVQIKKSRE